MQSPTWTLLFPSQPLPELDPSYSAPVRAPPTEMSRAFVDDDDEDIEETSGQEVEKTTVIGITITFVFDVVFNKV